MKLILLPGMDGTGELFAKLLTALDKRISVVIIRYPPGEPLTYQQILARVRNALPVDESYFLLGESFSGPVAFSLAAEQPAGLKGLILCASFIRAPLHGLTMLPWLSRIIPFGILPGWLLAIPLFGWSWSTTLRSALSSALAKVSSEVLQHRLHEVLTVDVTAAAKAVQVPVLYLQATEDLLVPKSAARLLNDLMPTVRIAKFKAPHMLLQVAPTEAASVIELFMAQYH